MYQPMHLLSTLSDKEERERERESVPCGYRLEVKGSTFSDGKKHLRNKNSEETCRKKKSFIRTNRFHRAPASIPKKIYSEIFVKTILFVVQVSQTITRGGPRTQIAIPAQGMIEFRDALTDLLEEYGTDDGGFKGDLPEGRYMRVDSKNFYFDIGQNNRGIYMRISEVRAYRWLKIRGVS